MAVKTAFNPAYGNGQNVAVGLATARIEIGRGSQSLCLSNTGSTACYVKTGDVTVEAVVGEDYIVLPGTQIVLTKDEEHTHLAYIAAAATTLHAIPGEGL